MTEDALYRSWHRMLNAMRLEALRMWRDAYAPWCTVEDLFATDLRRVRIVCDAFPEGTWHIAIHCRARSPRKTEWYFWKVRMVAGEYVII